MAAPPRARLRRSGDARDGIARADAERLVRAATAEVAGTALPVERDDGRFEVEVRAPGRRHHEVVLDDAFRVVGADDD